MRTTAALAALFVLAAVANAQLPLGLINGVSTGCLAGLASLLTNTELNSCLAITAAVTGIGALSQNDSVIPAVDTYIGSSLCPANVCSTSALRSANNTISSACASDIQNGRSILPGLLQLIMSQYTALKTASCFEDTKANDQICVTQTLTNLQQNLGTNLSLSQSQTPSNSSPSSLPQLLQRLSGNSSAFCTDCNRGLLSTLSPALQGYLNASTLQSLQQAVDQGCGSSFQTSGVPSDLRQTAKLNGSSGSSASGTNAGFSLYASVLTAGSVLTAVGLALLM